MNNKTVKNPRRVATAETTSKWHIIENPNGLTEEDMATLTAEHYNLSGVYPYMVDFINYICTHNKHKIDRMNDGTETHYRICINTKEFYQIMVGKKFDYQLGYIKKEIHRLFLGKDNDGNSTKKVLPLNRTHNIKTEPIRISIVSPNEWNKKYSNLKSINKGNPDPSRIKGGYIIEFYKPLWSDIIQNEKSKNWFPVPTFFQLALVDCIKKNSNNPVFKRYGNFGKVTNYRKLFLYLNLHDNSKADRIEYDALDLIKSSLPSNVQLQNDRLAIKNWTVAHQFIQKGMRLFHEMATIGLMDGVKIIPNKIQYNQPLNKIICKLSRGDYEDLLPFKSKVTDAKTNKIIDG